MDDSGLGLERVDVYLSRLRTCPRILRACRDRHGRHTSGLRLGPQRCVRPSDPGAREGVSSMHVLYRAYLQSRIPNSNSDRRHRVEDLSRSRSRGSDIGPSTQELTTQYSVLSTERESVLIRRGCEPSQYPAVRPTIARLSSRGVDGRSSLRRDRRAYA